MRRIVAALALAACAGVAGADEAEGWYGGGLDASRSRLGFGAPGMALGYRFSPNFQVEGHYSGTRGFGYAPGLEYGPRPFREPGLRFGGEPGTGIMIGAGATYEFSRRLYGRLSWSRDPTRPADFNFYQFGVGVRF